MHSPAAANEKREVVISNWLPFQCPARIVYITSTHLIGQDLDIQLCLVARKSGNCSLYLRSQNLRHSSNEGRRSEERQVSFPQVLNQAAWRQHSEITREVTYLSLYLWSHFP